VAQTLEGELRFDKLGAFHRAIRGGIDLEIVCNTRVQPITLPPCEANHSIAASSLAFLEYAERCKYADDKESELRQELVVIGAILGQHDFVDNQVVALPVLRLRGAYRA
jgi:hypothetical protein